MPHYNAFPVRSPVVEPLLVAGRFNGDPTKTVEATPSTRTAGKDYIAWRNATGIYRVKIDRPGARVISGNFAVRLATPAAKFGGTVVGTADNGRSIEFMVVNASGAAVDLTSSDEIWFHVLVQVSRLSIT